MIAEYETGFTPAAPTTKYLTQDHLGSPRAITDQNGAIVSRHDYRAFGEEVYSGTASRSNAQGYGQADGVRKQYTGYERDQESGLDFAEARYYNSKLGRFTSVDPLTASANVKDPQTFNRYSYAMNSPYKFTDPLGLISRSGCPPDCPTLNGVADGNGGVDAGRIAVVEVNDESPPPPVPVIEATTLAGTVGTSIQLLPTIALPTFSEAAGGVVSAVGRILSVPGIILASPLPGGSNCQVATGDDFCGNNPLKTGELTKVGEGATAIPITAEPPTEPVTDLYRAVSPAELADITISGGRFVNPHGVEAKYFATNAAGAISYAEQTNGTALYQGPYTLVGTQIPSNMITPINRATVDRGISTVVLFTPQLPYLTPAKVIGPIPTVPK